MEVEEEAKAAIAALNGYNLNGCKMNVEVGDAIMFVIVFLMV